MAAVVSLSGGALFANFGGAGVGHDLPDPAPHARPARRPDHDLRSATICGSRCARPPHPS
jgi:hypothetical protein